MSKDARSRQDTFIVSIEQVRNVDALQVEIWAALSNESAKV
jgi:hypothetical protein